MKKTNKTSIIIEVDTGIDDCVAFGLALFSKEVSVKLITCGAGNVDVDSTVRNTLNVLSMLKKRVPVARGESEPLKRKRTVKSVHGEDGIAGYVFPPHDLKAEEKDAVSMMKEVLESSEEKLTIIELGPITNVAKLLNQHPEVKPKIEKIVFMAGSNVPYNENEIPYAGFNVKVDPEAAEMVLKSGVEVVLCPMDIGHDAYLTYKEVYRTKQTNSTGRFFEQLFRKYKDHHVRNGIAMHDSCAVAYVLNKNLFKTQKLNVQVKYFDELQTGVMVCDFNKTPKNVEVCMDINIKKFKELYFRRLKRMP